MHVDDLCMRMSSQQMSNPKMNLKNAFDNANVLVVGGSGFIGRALVQRLVCLESRVISLGIRRSSILSGQIKSTEYITADVTDPLSLTRALKGKRFDYVFNLGGYIDHLSLLKGGRQLIDAHYTGMINLIEQVSHNQLKCFVQVGSSDEYGKKPSPQNEAMREAPISPYSAAKTAATHLIQAMSRTENFPGVVARLFLVYGPGQDDKRFLPQIIKGCLQGAAFPVSEGKQLRDFCYIEDIVEGLLLSAVQKRARGEVINLASGKPVSIRSVIETVVKFIGRGNPEFGVHPYRPGESMELYADVKQAAELIGWRPVRNLEQGLEETISWYKKRMAI